MTKPYRRVPLANTIHQWRQRHILSEKECAKIFGITTKRLYRIELHHHTALPPHIVALMRQLDEEWGECRLYDAIAHKLPPYDPSKDPPKKRKSPTMKPKHPADPAAVPAPKAKRKRGRPAGSGRKRTIIPPPGLEDALAAMETAEKDRAKRLHDIAAVLSTPDTPDTPNPTTQKPDMPLEAPQKPVHAVSTQSAPTLPATPPEAAQPLSLTAAVAELEATLAETAPKAVSELAAPEEPETVQLSPTELKALDRAIRRSVRPLDPPPEPNTFIQTADFPPSIVHPVYVPEPVPLIVPNDTNLPNRELPPPGFVEAIAAVPSHEPEIPWDTPQAHPQPLTARPIIPPTKTRRAPSQAPRRMPSPLPAAPGVKPPGEWE